MPPPLRGGRRPPNGQVGLRYIQEVPDRYCVGRLFDTFGHDAFPLLVTDALTARQMEPRRSAGARRGASRKWIGTDFLLRLRDIIRAVAQ